ncbi:MAG: DUF4010 domain-containing protein [Bacteroidota bacterium]
MITIIEWTTDLRLLVALALAFLIGLERESTKAEHRYLFLGGVRTYPIVSMLGFGTAYVHRLGIPHVLAVGFLAMSALTVVAYIHKIKEGRTGATSEVSFLLTFSIGALALLVDVWIPMTIGIVSTILLSEKAELEKFVDRLDRVGFLATLRLLLVTLIILPVLPSREFTQFRLNPARIWQIVIIVSAIGYVGYLLSKRFGGRMGLRLSGLLGGIVSSTAVSFSMGRLARTSPERSTEALQATLLASSIMYLRVLALVWIFNSALMSALTVQLVLLALLGGVISWTVRHGVSTSAPESTELQNPFEIRPAVVFAILFVALSVLTSLVRAELGDLGTLVLSWFAGLGDADPFILSVVQAGSMEHGLVARAVLLALMSNTIAKAAYFGFLAPGVRRDTAIRFGVLALLHIPLLLIG